MNIFYLDKNPALAAQYHSDKHIVKMIVESGQMLSTAHRVLDGQMIKKRSRSGKRMVNYYEHPNGELEQVLYKAVHVNHPSTVWTRASAANYVWHYDLFKELCAEYTHRYNKIHSTETLLSNVLKCVPLNMDYRAHFTPPTRAMGSEPLIRNDLSVCNVTAYRRFYITKEIRMPMIWSKRNTPYWWRWNHYRV